MFSERTRSYVALALIVGAVMGGVKLLQSHEAVELGQVLRAQARAGDIRMIGSRTCIYCDRARSWLNEQRVPFKECVIETDPACLAEFQARGGQGTPTFVVRGRTLVGFDPTRIGEVLTLLRRQVPG